jgi:hypothetical protein
VKFLKQIFHLLKRLAPAGCERDTAGNRRLLYSQYASLILLGLFNPTMQSLRGLSELSRLKKVQKILGGGKASIGSLSESVRVFDPALLEDIFHELRASLPDATASPTGGLIPQELMQRLQAVDGSALRALPQIVHAIGEGKWRLHLQLEVQRNLPAQARLTRDEIGGEADERNVLAGMLQSRRIYILDRGYERYHLMQQIVTAQSDYVLRVQTRSLRVMESRPLSAEATTAGILSDDLVQPGKSRPEVAAVTHPVRRIILTETGPRRRRTDRPASSQVVLLTSLTELPAELIAAIYRLRWSIELFFKFFKHVLGCRQLLSHRDPGVAIQIYCGLIAALLLSLASGQSVGRRGFELICLFLQGWADEEELVAGLQRLTRAQKQN